MIIPYYERQMPAYTMPGPGDTDPADPHTEYVGFRSLFRANPTVIAADGMPAFICAQDPTKLKTFRPFSSWDEINLVDGHVIDLAGADDSIAHVDEWHFYVSDPSRASRGPGRWRAYRTDPDAGLTSTRSGRVTLRLSEAALTQLLSGGTSAEDLAYALRGVHIYALKIATGEVGWADLYRCAFAASGFPSVWPTY